MPRHEMEHEEEKHTSSQGVLPWSLRNSVYHLGNKVPVTPGNARMVLYTQEDSDCMWRR
jgi:hypothetical protein